MSEPELARALHGERDHYRQASDVRAENEQQALLDWYREENARLRVAIEEVLRYVPADVEASWQGLGVYSLPLRALVRLREASR